MALGGMTTLRRDDDGVTGMALGGMTTRPVQNAA
jgi:hypothetical protein